MWIGEGLHSGWMLFALVVAAIVVIAFVGAAVVVVIRLGRNGRATLRPTGRDGRRVR